MYISKKYSKKLEKHLWRALFCKSFGITYHSLPDVKYDTRNLTKVLFTTLNYKKKRDNIKGSYAFQATAIELYKQPKETNRKRTPKISLVISSIRVGVVGKTDDEVYVSSIIKIYSYFLFVFTTVPKRVQLLKISKVM